MNDSLRACLAYIGAQAMKQTRKTSVYDFSQSRNILVSGRIDGNRVNAHDFDRGTHIGGTLPNLYDYGLRCHVSMTVTGSQMQGFDHGSGSHYSGRLNGNTMTIYDDETVRHYYYAV